MIYPKSPPSRKLRLPLFCTILLLWSQVNGQGLNTIDFPFVHAPDLDVSWAASVVSVDDASTTLHMRCIPEIRTQVQPLNYCHAVFWTATLGPSVVETTISRTRFSEINKHPRPTYYSTTSCELFPTETSAHCKYTRRVETPGPGPKQDGQPVFGQTTFDRKSMTYSKVAVTAGFEKLPSTVTAAVPTLTEVVAPSSTNEPLPLPPSSTDSDSSSEALSTTAKAGIGIGVGGAALAAIIVTIMLFKHKQRMKKIPLAGQHSAPQTQLNPLGNSRRAWSSGSPTESLPARPSPMVEYYLREMERNPPERLERPHTPSSEGD